VVERERERARQRLGLLWMLLATASFVGMSGFVKVLREDGLTTSDVVFWRTAPGLLWIVVELRLRKQRVWPNQPLPVVTRSIAGLGAMLGYFYALRFLTMIENTVLSLLQPVLVAMLSPMLLGERLHRRALVALVVALTGAMVVLRPDLAWRSQLPVLPVLVGAGAALCSALAHIYVRKSTAHDSPEVVVFWFTVVVSLGALVSGAIQGDLFDGLPAGLELGEAAWKVGAMAGFGLIGQLLMTRAYGRASAPLVAMVAYASIPLSILVDLAWGVRPELDDWLGSLLMIAAGVVLVRDRS
jgi:drug/metabolite transporter (DMT)-like permease